MSWALWYCFAILGDLVGLGRGITSKTKMTTRKCTKKWQIDLVKLDPLPRNRRKNFGEMKRRRTEKEKEENTWRGKMFGLRRRKKAKGKIGGSQNSMKERHLSKTPFLTFVYISKCNINLPGYFGNSKKRFLWTGLMYIVHTYKICCRCVSVGFNMRLQWERPKKYAMLTDVMPQRRYSFCLFFRNCF